MAIILNKLGRIEELGVEVALRLHTQDLRDY
jgi:hypothetical protein